MRRLESFLPAHLSMIAWAIARSGGRWGGRFSNTGSSIKCLSLIAQAASSRLPTFKSKEIAIILWSLSWAGGHDDSILFYAAPLELLARLQRKSVGRQSVLSFHVRSFFLTSISSFLSLSILLVGQSSCALVFFMRRPIRLASDFINCRFLLLLFRILLRADIKPCSSRYNHKLPGFIKTLQ